MQGVSSAYKGLNEAQQAHVKALQDEQRASLNLAKAEKSQTLETAKLTIKKQQLTKASKQAALEELGLLSAYDKVVKKMNEAGKSVQNLTAKKLQGIKLSDKEQLELRQSTIEFTKYRKAVIGADNAIGRSQRNVGNYPKVMRGAASAARSLASALGLVGGAFLVVSSIRNAFNTVREFDKQVIAVQKTTNLTTPEIKLFKEEVIDLGLALKGVSIQGLLKSSEIAGQLGIKGRSNILKFSEVIEKLKLTSDIAGEESARSFAKFIEVSTDSVKNADRLGSVITELGNNFATSESQILKNSLEIQKGIAIYDASAQGVLGLGAATNALGAEAEQSRSALQKTFKVLNDGAANGKNLEEILALTGQTASEFKDEFGSDSVRVFDRFIKGLASSVNEGKNLTNTLTELGLSEKRTEAVVGVLAKNYGVLENALKRANNEYASNTALNKEVALASESLNSKIGDLSDSLDGLILTVENGQGKLSSFFKNIIDFTDGAINGLKSLIQTQEEYNKSLENNISNKKYKEELDFYEQLGDSAKRVAIERADRSRDEVDAINKEIEALKVRNSLIEKNKNTSVYGGFGTNELSENEDKIESLSIKLGIYNGVLRASEDFLEGVTEQISENTKTTKENEDAVLEANKARKKTTEAIKGSIKYYEQLISKLTEQQKSVATNKEEWEAYQKQINDVQNTLDDLKESFKGVETLFDKLDFSGIEKISDAFDRITEILNTPQVIEGIEIEGALEDLDEWSKAFEEQQKKITELHKHYADQRANIEEELSENIKDLAFSVGDAIFESQLNRLDKEEALAEEKAERALQFAGGNAQAEAEIQEQLSQRKEDIEKERIETEKKAFLFQQAFRAGEIAIDTIKSVAALKAQAAILLANPVTAPLAGIALGQIPLVIATGAVAGAAVLAQTIPAFKDGGITPGGEVLVNDRKSTNYKEVIRTPKGDIIKPQKRNTIINLPKGSEVFSSEDEFMKDLQRLTDINNIMFDSSLFNLPDVAPNINIENNSVTAEQMDMIIAKHFSNIKTTNTIIDKKGIQTFISKGSSKTINLNNKVEFKGISV